MTDAQKNSKPPAGDELQSSFIAVFIRRPILAMVVSLLIVIAGLAALLGVEVRELPDVDQPVVTVRVSYPGATPESIDAEVVSVIENAVSRVDGVTAISSNSSFANGNVVIEFSPNTNIDVAATDVRNAVASAQRNLPQGIEEPQVVKADSDSSPIMRIAVFAPNMGEGELGELIDRIILPRLQAVDGVASVEDYGVRKRAIRVRLSPVDLAARGVAVDDVAQVVARAAINAPSGTLQNRNQEILIRAEAPATTPEHIAALRLNDETVVGDVALVEWDVERLTTVMRVDRAQAAGLGVLRQAKSNTVAVADGVRAAIAELEPVLPNDVYLNVTSDDSIFIKRAIEEVVFTLGMATVIVIMVLFAFLRDWRTTLIPTIVIPIALIGTVAAVWLIGFSINILTLLAFVMATGLVVDDAIVVTENVQRWRQMGYRKRAAALLGTKEIVFAIISTSATLAAVFIPISFLPGQAGRLFSEFGFVMAIAVVLSSFVALTLAPMLTVRFGRNRDPETGEVGPGKFALLDRIGSAGKGAYEGALRFCLRAPIIPFAAAIVFAAGAVLSFHLVPKELTPTEDRGRLFMIVSVQQSANVHYMQEKVREIEDRLRPYVDSGEATTLLSLVGWGGGSRGFVLLQLADWSERDRSAQEIQAEVQPILAEIPGLSVSIRGGNSLGIRGAGQGLTFAVAGDDYAEAADAAEAIAARLEENPMFTRAALNFETSQPQLNVNIDRDAASRLGVEVSSVTTLVSSMADEYRAAELFVGDTIVDVLLSAGGSPLTDPASLSNLFVRTNTGAFVPVSLVADIEEVAVSARLSREQRRRAVPATASLAPGVPLGDAIEELNRVAASELPGGMAILLLGEAKILQQSADSSLIVFAFAGLIVLLVLAAQFESFISAAVIMVTVPFGLAAAVYAMLLTGGSLNYYSQIGLVLLIGIMAKNGILIVEFANQLRDRGLSVREAIYEASITRLRPVLMTALSTVLGGLPLIVGSGAGAEARAALGWVIMGGLGFATFFTLFLTPTAYLLLGRFAGTRAKEGRLIETELAEGRRFAPPDAARLPGE